MSDATFTTTMAGNDTVGANYAKLDTVDIITIVAYFILVVAVGLYVSI